MNKCRGIQITNVCRLFCLEIEHHGKRKGTGNRISIVAFIIQNKLKNGMIFIDFKFGVSSKFFRR